MSLVLIGKDLVLEAKQRTNGFQVYIYIFIIIYTYEQNHMSICLVQASPHDAIDTSESLRI